MIVLESKLKGNPTQFAQIDDAIKTAQFIRNKGLRYWMDNQRVGQDDLSKLCAVIDAGGAIADALDFSTPQHRLLQLHRFRWQRAN